MCVEAHIQYRDAQGFGAEGCLQSRPESRAKTCKRVLIIRIKR